MGVWATQECFNVVIDAMGKQKDIQAMDSLVQQVPFKGQRGPGYSTA